jgi:hypothetical protein
MPHIDESFVDSQAPNADVADQVLPTSGRAVLPELKAALAVQGACMEHQGTTN